MVAITCNHLLILFYYQVIWYVCVNRVIIIKKSLCFEEEKIVWVWMVSRFQKWFKILALYLGNEQQPNPE